MVRLKMWFPMSAAVVLLLGACASSEGPAMLVISADHYAETFDAAVEAAYRHGMPALRRDRRGGIIETDVRITGSVMEPWRGDNADFSQAMENTLSLQRRHIRFEFVPNDEPVEALTGDPPLTGPDATGAGRRMSDLTQYTGEIRVVAWVAVERAYQPGLRHSTWSRRSSNRTRIIEAEGQESPGSYWTTVSRDTAFERRLLAEIQNSISVASTGN